MSKATNAAWFAAIIAAVAEERFGLRRPTLGGTRP